MISCFCNLSWLSCKMRGHQGKDISRGYYCHMSVGFAFMPNHDFSEVDRFQNVVKDCTVDCNEHLVANKASQGIAEWETLTIDEAFCLMDLSRGQCLPVGTFLSLCEKCREVKDVDYARRVLLYVQNAGLEDEPVISYNLMLMLLECRCLRDAQQLFARMVHRTEQCWATLIHGYSNHGKPETALDLFQEFQHDPTRSSKHAIIGALKACTILQELECGRLVHSKAAEEMVEMDQFVSNTLVDMYMNCSCLVDARAVFDRLQRRDLVSWNVLIAGYAEHGDVCILKQCFRQMTLDGVSPDSITYLCILKSCSRDKLLGRIHEVHLEIVKRGFDIISSVGNNLVHLYAQHSSFAEARRVLNLQSAPEEIAWTSLIGGYVENDNLENALSCLNVMEGLGISPSVATYVVVLKTCASVLDGLAMGRNIHSEIVKRAIEVQAFVGNSLIDMYCKCGSLLDAQYIFNQLPVPDVFSWTAFLFGYVEHGLPEEALRCLHQMQAEGVAPNAVSYICSVKACQIAADICKGQELHINIVKEEFEADPVLGNTLVDFYANCGLLAEAKEVFDRLPIRNVVSWNTLMSGYAEEGNAEMTLHCLKQMEDKGIVPTATTFLCGLKACGSPCTLFLAQKIHSCAVKKGLEGGLSLKNSFLDVYLKCNMVPEANNVFFNSGERDIVSWNSLMGGYADAGLCCEVFDGLKRMQEEGTAPNTPTFLSILKSCKLLGLIDRGQTVHSMVIKSGFEREPHVASALVDMYAMHGNLGDAGSVFYKQQVPSIVAWTALIVGYMEQGCGEKALETYDQMRQLGVSPDYSLYVCVMKACGNVGARNKGLELYGEVMIFGILQESIGQRNSKMSINQDIDKERSDSITLNLHNVVIDMFCKCGSVVDAQKVFDTVPVNDSVTWNALIAGYVLQGDLLTMIPILHKMKTERVWPDAVTYTSALTACSHVGSMETCNIFMEEMSKVYGVLPLRRHYNCVIDLFSRAGQLGVVLEMVEKIPFQPDVVTWLTVLGGCRKSAAIDVGTYAFTCAMSLAESDLPGFVLLSNMYVNAQFCEDETECEVMKVRLRTGVG